MTTDHVVVSVDQQALRLVEGHFQDCKNRALKIDEARLTSLRPQISGKVRDFLCVLKCKKTHSQLLAMGDPGFIKLVQVFGGSILAVDDGPVRRRYQAAVRAGDRNFLNKVDDALKRQRDIDRRVKGDKFVVKSFLFLNWDIPFTVDTPLQFLTNPQIVKLLGQFFLNESAARFEVWNEERIKKEIRILGLRRPSKEQPANNQHS
jgi:hypothetical protein